MAIPGLEDLEVIGSDLEPIDIPGQALRPAGRPPTESEWARMGAGIDTTGQLLSAAGTAMGPAAAIAGNVPSAWTSVNPEVEERARQKAEEYGLLTPLSDISKAAVGDVATSMRMLSHPSTAGQEAALSGGNIRELFGEDDQLPIEKALQASSEEQKFRGETPIASSVGHGALGLAQTAPLIAGGMTLPRAGQALLGTAFGAKMILQDAPELARRIGEEKGKPESQRDPDLLNKLYGDAGTILLFTGLGAAGGPRMLEEIGQAGTKIPGIGRAFTPLANVRNTPLTFGDTVRIFARDMPKANQLPPELVSRAPIRELGVRVPPPENVLGMTPELQQLAGEALTEASPTRISVPGERPALDVIRDRLTQPILPPAPFLTEARPGGGPALSGQIGAAARAEAQGIPSARQSVVDLVREEAGGTEPSPLIQQVHEIVHSKDRTGLEEMRRDLAGADVEDVELAKMRRAPTWSSDGQKFIRLQTLADSVPEIEMQIEGLRRVMERTESFGRDATDTKAYRDYKDKMSGLQQRLKNAQEAKARLERAPGAQAPGVGVARGTSSDLIRLIDQRLKELESNKPHPENNAIRDVFKKAEEAARPQAQRPEPTVQTYPPGPYKQLPFRTAEGEPKVPPGPEAKPQPGVGKNKGRWEIPGLGTFRDEATAADFAKRFNDAKISIYEAQAVYKRGGRMAVEMLMRERTGKTPKTVFPEGSKAEAGAKMQDEIKAGKGPLRAKYEKQVASTAKKLIAEGYTDYNQWREELIKRHGLAANELDLQRIFNEANPITPEPVEPRVTPAAKKPEAPPTAKPPPEPAERAPAPESPAALTHEGANLIEGGVKTLRAFQTEMIRKFGPEIIPKLNKLWTDSIETLKARKQREGKLSGSRFERWADDTIRRMKSLGVRPVGTDEALAAYAIKGAAMIERGIRTFAEWSNEMIKQFGETIRPHLQSLWERANEHIKKGVPDAIKERAEQSDVQQQRERTDAQRVSAEAGAGDSLQREAAQRAQTSQANVPSKVGVPEPTPDQLATTKFVSKGVTKPSLGPEYFHAAGDAVLSPDFWVNLVKRLGKGDLYAQESVYQAGLYLRQLGMEKADPVIEAIQNARAQIIETAENVRNKLHSETDPAKKMALLQSDDFALGSMTQFPREIIEAAFDRGSAKGAVPEDVAPPLGKTYDLEEAAAEFRRQPGREFVPAIKDASGKVTEGNTHDELVRSGITGTRGFTDPDGNFLSLTEVARRKGAAEQYPELPSWMKNDFKIVKASEVKGEERTAMAAGDQYAAVDKFGNELYETQDQGYASGKTVAEVMEKLKSDEKYFGEPTVESVTSLDPQSGQPLSATDSLINKLEGLKYKTDAQGRVINPGGQVFSLPHPDAIKMIGKTAWNTAIDTAIAAIKAGKKIGEAIDAALTHLKRNVSNFNETQIRANLDNILREEVPGAGTARAAGPVARTRPLNAKLDDVYDRFRPEKPVRPTIPQRITNAYEWLRTSFSSKFRPLDKLAEDIAKAYGGGVQRVAHLFEQLKGSSGKAEADVYRFDEEVTKLVGKNTEDFNAYIFLTRSLDRLKRDAADLQTALAGGQVRQLNRRAVSDYTIPELEAKLRTLKQKLSPRDFDNLRRAGELYQEHMDAALSLQLISGRMSPELYKAIKEGNEFYAPFRLHKYLVETARAPGSGKQIDTLADFAKAMKGIQDPNFKLGDMLAAGRQNIVMSRILAEKNMAMRKFADMADADVDHLFVKKLGRNEDPPFGKQAVNVMRDGQVERYAVDKSISQAVKMFGGTVEPLSKWLRYAAVPFRAGATTANIAFQGVNLLLADLPRSALFSKTGIGGPHGLFTEPGKFMANAAKDIIALRFPIQFVQSFFDAMESNLLRKDTKMALDYLDSGAAGAVIQDYLTPDLLKWREQTGRSLPRRLLTSVLAKPAEFAKAIEETNKILGIRRAKTFYGAMSGKEMATFLPDVITEIRRFSGSPDFGRIGQYTDAARLNFIFMFFNARIQGAVADIGRLMGRDGADRAATTWARVITAVGIPTAALYYFNHLPQYRADYEARPKNERDNYWLIPKNTYITDDQGNKMRDYWRIPKRESAQLVANMIESALGFAKKHDPEAFWGYATDTLENVSPLNIRGDSVQERVESMVSSLNPALKAPIELGTGRDTFRHRDIVPDSMKKASPENQYLDRTPTMYRGLAKLMPDVAPEALRSPLMLENFTQNMTAGLIQQFLPSRSIPGRSGIEMNPLLRRFQAAPYSEDPQQMKEIKSLQREAADNFLNKDRAAKESIQNQPTIQDVAKFVAKKYGTNDNAEAIFERSIDLWLAQKNGITRPERQILALPTEQRAKYILNKLAPLDPKAKMELLEDYQKKRILTEGVIEEMISQIPQSPSR